MKKAWVIHHNEPTPGYNSKEMLKAFSKRNIEVRLINFSKFTVNDDDNLAYDGDVLQEPDFAVFTNQTQTILGAAAYANRNDVIHKLNNFENTTFINNPLAHAETCNKIVVYQKLDSAGISFPKTEYISTSPDLDTLLLMLSRIGSYPVVVKHPISFEGAGVELCHDQESVLTTIQELKSSSTFGIGTFVLQEYIRNPDTAMFCVRVVGDKIFTRMFLFTPYNTSAFKAFVALGRQQLPCETPTVIKDAVMSTMNTLGLDTARIDLFLTKDGVKVFDVNSIGSLLPTDQTHNIRTADLIVDYAIKKKLANHD